MGPESTGENGVQIDDALRQRAEECARACGVPISEVVREALEEYLAAHASKVGPSPSPRTSLAETADLIAARVPPSEWAQVPADLGKNFEHYRYGYPRED